MDPQGGLKPLPQSGPYVQPVNFQGATALHLAAFYGHLAVTDLLLAAGACDVTARNSQVRRHQLLSGQHFPCLACVIELSISIVYNHRRTQVISFSCSARQIESIAILYNTSWGSTLSPSMKHNK